MQRYHYITLQNSSLRKKLALLMLLTAETVLLTSMLVLGITGVINMRASAKLGGLPGYRLTRIIKK